MPEDKFDLQEGLSIYRYIMPTIESNMYMVYGKGSALAIDPNENEEAIATLMDREITKVIILLTHEHIDHISGVNRFRRQFGEVEVICSKLCAGRIGNPSKNLAKFWDVIIMEKDEFAQKQADELIDRSYTCFADETFHDTMEFDFDGHRIRLTAAPGHSPGGSLIFLDETVAFTGDNLVEGNGVITRFPGGKKKDFWNVTAPMLEELKDDCFIFPGHGMPGRMMEMRQYLTDFKRKDNESGHSEKSQKKRLVEGNQVKRMTLAIYCSGDAGKDVLKLAQDNNRWEQIIFVDDVVDEKEVCGIPVYRFREMAEWAGDLEFAIANGEPKNRETLFNKVKSAGYKLATIISSKACIEKGTTIGEGCIIHDCHVGANTIIRENVVINGESSIGHHSVVGAHSVIAWHVFASGGCRIDDFVYIAPFAMLRDKIHIGKYAIISMGAVILRNVKEEAIMVGNPAKRIGKNEEHRVFNMFNLN